MRAHGQLRAFAAWGGAQIQHPVAILRPERGGCGHGGGLLQVICARLVQGDGPGVGIQA